MLLLWIEEILTIPLFSHSIFIGIGTYVWMPPEMHQETISYQGPENDIWVFGEFLFIA